jgi:hypothetical protein
MRAREFITENTSLQADVAAALPATYVIPALQNQDPYLQYRFGMAIAKSRGKNGRGPEVDRQLGSTSIWGENQVVVAYPETEDQYLDDALRDVGLSPSDKQLISTAKSEETKTVNKTSPVPARRPNRYGV